MFVDNARVTVKGGKGGDGCNSSYRDKMWRYPKPDGGDGGNGGNVIIRADNNLLTLYDFKFRQHFTALSGGHGSSNKKTGRDAADTVVRVPVGTIITEEAIGCKLRELLEDGQEIVVARGGLGGKGSAHLKYGDHEGTLGEEKILILDLKLIADVGLVGFPNSGKSTLISKISAAHPKIAPYPFTTKAPVLGVVESGVHTYSVADIPGLIKDSHVGKGLGDRFLRHVEHTKILLHMIDIAGSDGRDPIEDYRVISDELKFYSREVFKKQKILVANKIDLPSAKQNLVRFKKSVKERIIPISALENEGIGVLLNAIEKKLFARSN